MFEKSNKIRIIAERLIDDHYPHLQDAKEVVEYYAKHDNTAKWSGKCKKCTEFDRFQTGHMFYIFIDGFVYENATEATLKALIDHELMHIVRVEAGSDLSEDKSRIIMTWAPKEDPGNWSIREHDIEEFGAIVERHGLWDVKLEKFAAVTRNAPHQMTIDEVSGGLRAVK